MKTLSTLKTRSSKERGQAMVEFALVLPIIILIVVGVVDLGRAIYAYSVISNAAREGARYASVDPTNTAEITTRTKALTSGLEASHIRVFPSCVINVANPAQAQPPNPCDAWNFYEVRVEYDFQPATMFFASMTLKSQSTMTIE